jgi:hypothetical protein
MDISILMPDRQTDRQTDKRITLDEAMEKAYNDETIIGFSCNTRKSVYFITKDWKDGRIEGRMEGLKDKRVACK